MVAMTLLTLRLVSDVGCFLTLLTLLPIIGVRARDTSFNRESVRRVRGGWVAGPARIHAPRTEALKAAVFRPVSLGGLRSALQDAGCWPFGNRNGHGNGLLEVPDSPASPYRSPTDRPREAA